VTRNVAEFDGPRPDPESRKVMTIPNGRMLSLLLSVGLGVSVGGCDSLSGFVKQETSNERTASLPRQAPRLQAGDKVKLVVFGEDKISGDYEIDQNGRISVPLIGAVRAAGLTKKDLEQALAARLREGQILRDPVVTIDVSSFRPFYVLGEVEKPGEYTFRNGLNVMSAVAVAGGYTYRASKSKVMVQRAGEKNFTEYELSPDIPIHPGDLVSVPERYF
jgi:protein involved in polysaccharide export with SLBB domain